MRFRPGLPAILKWRLVSRDRANGFAEAISQVLPHATQVADRYHLIQNLRDHLQQFLDRKRACLPFVEDTPVDAKQGSPGGKGISLTDRPQAIPEADSSNLLVAERKKLISRNKRLARYEEVMALYREGVSQREISRQLHLSRNTVQHYVSSPGFPSLCGGNRTPKRSDEQTRVRMCPICETSGMQATTTARTSFG